MYPIAYLGIFFTRTKYTLSYWFFFFFINEVYLYIVRFGYLKIAHINHLKTAVGCVWTSSTKWRHNKWIKIPHSLQLLRFHYNMTILYFLKIHLGLTGWFFGVVRVIMCWRKYLKPKHYPNKWENMYTPRIQ